MKTVGTIITLLGAALLLILFILLAFGTGTNGDLIAAALAGLGIVAAGTALMYRP